MNKLQINTHPDVKSVFEQYPAGVRIKLQHLRALIIEVADQIDEISELEETLKWGEPSYLVKNGSTIRIDYKNKDPNHYAIYFKCTSKLVPTFREVFGDAFTYQKNRAIVFNLEKEVPLRELKKCIELALRYHSLKHLNSLGY